MVPNPSGFLYILTACLLQTITVFCDRCGMKSCEHGCCDDDCCSESFWNWYTIIGVVVAGIFGLIFVVGVTILLCVYCTKSKQSSRTRPVSTGFSRPVHLSSNVVHPPPYTATIGQPMPPPYSAVYEAPPKYEVVQPQVRNSSVPQPQRSSGVPVRTNSRHVNRNVNHT